MISDDRIKEIEILADGATPGPWKYDWGNWEVEKSEGRNPVCRFDCDDDLKWFPRLVEGHSDGEYIAAIDPTTIKELITERKQLVAIADIAEVFEDLPCYCEDMELNNYSGVCNPCLLAGRLQAWKTPASEQGKEG